jgi:uncharacterized protein
MQTITLHPIKEAIPSFAAAQLVRVRPVKSLQVILKTVERCNLACTYCYYFFMGDESYLDRDPVIRVDRFQEIADFLVEGAKSLNLGSIRVVFHGGEPMMQKPREFQQLCHVLSTSLEGVCELILGIQTNGTILSDEWLDIFEAYRVRIGVSIDGPQEYHDHFRVDRKGRSSYEEIARNLRLMHRYFVQKRLSSLGTITVMNAAFSTARVFRHLRDDLGIVSQSYLLPDRSYEHPFEPGETPERYGELLAELFDVWVQDQEVSVREIQSIVNFFQLHKDETNVQEPLESSFNIQAYSTDEIIVIQSNGEVSIDDSLIPATTWRKNCKPGHIRSTSVEDFINTQDFLSLNQVHYNPPAACQSCKWLRLCGGGAPENRFSHRNGFDNPSVYCGGLKLFYEHVVAFLRQNGYPQELLDRKLGLEAGSTAVP